MLVDTEKLFSFSEVLNSTVGVEANLQEVFNAIALEIWMKIHWTVLQILQTYIKKKIADDMFQMFFFHTIHFHFTFFSLF